MQPGFDFTVDPVDPTKVSPTGQELPPINGKSIASRHASYTGAVHAQETRSKNIAAMRRVWREAKTINEVATALRLPVSSVCSLKAEIESELEAVGFETIDWGKGRKTTKRTKWRLRR